MSMSLANPATTAIIMGAVYQLLPVILETTLWSEKLGYVHLACYVAGVLLFLSEMHTVIHTRVRKQLDLGLRFTMAAFLSLIITLALALLFLLMPSDYVTPARAVGLIYGGLTCRKGEGADAGRSVAGRGQPDLAPCMGSQPDVPRRPSQTQLMNKRWLSGFAAIAVAAAVAGCGSGTRQAAVAGSGVGGAEVEVVMQNMAFKPQKLAVKLGTFDKPGRYTVFCSTANHHLLGM